MKFFRNRNEINKPHIRVFCQGQDFQHHGYDKKGKHHGEYVESSGCAKDDTTLTILAISMLAEAEKIANEHEKQTGHTTRVVVFDNETD